MRKRKFKLPDRKTILMILISCNQLSAQVSSSIPDNPHLDQIPLQMRENILKQPREPLSGNVITIDNWDNFALGTDFGESNMASHPGIPTWYFTAYNIDETHHTEDGSNWSANNPPWTGMAGDPVVAYDSLGNLYYINMYGSPVQGAKVIRSSTNGLTWETPVVGAIGNDKCWIACDQSNGPYKNSVYVTMTNNNSGYFARSRDQGQTFENTWNFTPQNIPGMSVCVGPYNNVQGGAVYVVTNSGETFSSTFTFYRSVNGGTSFTQMSSQQFAGYVGTAVGQRHSVEGMRTRPYPYIAADNSFGSFRGRLYCIYATNDPPGSGNKPDIWCLYSNNGGTTWSAAKRVNDDLNTQANHQWHPAIWCDKQTGRLYVQWMDTRDTPTHDSAFIYATYSDDGGISFKPNQRISNKKMKIDCPTCGGGGAPRYQGDYNGIVSNRKTSMAGWTDFRNGTFLSVTSYFPDFAMTLDKTADSLNAPADSTNILVSVPAVKLYSDTVVLSGEISPTPATGMITISFPAGNKIFSFPGSKAVRVKVNGNVPLGYYTVSVIAKGPNGTPVHIRTLTLKINSTEYLTVSANAMPPEICPGSTTQLMANVLGGIGPYSYSWSPQTGLNDPYIRNPLASPTVTTSYHVLVNDQAGHSGNDSVRVTILNVPPAPGTITGVDSTCTGATVFFSISAVPGATSYSWTVPPGSVIMEGQNTPSIEVVWGDTSGNVSVIAGNLCGTSNPGVKQVTLLIIPSIPGEIQGPGDNCLSATAVYSVEEIPGATTYTWSVPEGTIILSGQSTRTIEINWGTVAGAIHVVAGNLCGTSDPQSKYILSIPLPGPAEIINGADTVCLNHDSFIYTTSPIPGADSYIWELPPGAYITTGEGTDSIWVNYGPDAASGLLSVIGRNSCGNGIGFSKTVTVKPCTGVNPDQNNPLIKIYPNPSKKILNIFIPGTEKPLQICLINSEGKTVFTDQSDRILKDYSKSVDISGFPPGIYLFRVFDEDLRFSRKVIIE